MLGILWPLLNPKPLPRSPESRLGKGLRNWAQPNVVDPTSYSQIGPGGISKGTKWGQKYYKGHQKKIKKIYKNRININTTRGTTRKRQMGGKKKEPNETPCLFPAKRGHDESPGWEADWTKSRQTGDGKGSEWEGWGEDEECRCSDALDGRMTLRSTRTHGGHGWLFHIALCAGMASGAGALGRRSFTPPPPPPSLIPLHRGVGLKLT